MTNAEIEEALAPFLQVEAPKRLMKFFSPAGLPLLTHGTLKITPPSDFNDPFEFFPAIPDAPTKEHLRNWFLNPDSFLRAHHQKNYGSDYERWVETVGLTHPECWQGALNSVATGYMKAVSNSYGVSCFMDRDFDELKKPDIVHFWDRYAGCHTGFAVRFDLGVGLLKTIHDSEFLFAVGYPEFNQRLEITPERPTNNDEVLREFLLEIAKTKSVAWGAEKEWRLIAPFRAEPCRGLVTHHLVGEKIISLLNLWKDPAHPGQDRNDAGKEIREIYLGCRAEEDLKKTVFRLCHEKRLAHVAVFQTGICPHSYEFTYQQVK